MVLHSEVSMGSARAYRRGTCSWSRKGGLARRMGSEFLLRWPWLLDVVVGGYALLLVSPVQMCMLLDSAKMTTGECEHWIEQIQKSSSQAMKIGYFKGHTLFVFGVTDGHSMRS